MSLWAPGTIMGSVLHSGWHRVKHNNDYRYHFIGNLLRVKSFAKCFVCIMAFYLHSKPWDKHHKLHFIGKEKGSEKLNDLPKFTQVVSGKVRIWTISINFWYSSSFFLKKMELKFGNIPMVSKFLRQALQILNPSPNPLSYCHKLN